MTPHRALAAAAAVLVVALAGCSQPTPPSSPSASEPATAPASSPAATSAAPSTPESSAPAETATEIAERIADKIPTAEKVVTITEDNDSNNSIGRPGGYIDAAVIYDSGVEQCIDTDGPGVDCGAKIEIFPTAEEAEKRKAYIEAIGKESPVFADGLIVVDGPVVFRVAREIKPSIAKTYGAAFAG